MRAIGSGAAAGCRYSVNPSRVLLIARLIALLGSVLLAAASGQQAGAAGFAGAAKKFAWLTENGRSANPSTRPTVLTADEWNAYLNEGGVKLPEGVTAVRITSEPGMAHADAEVDFDRLTANRTRSNPLLGLFTGKHHVTATARLAAANGMGTVEVESVQFDGVEIPRFALEYFAGRYLRPKYGSAIGMDSTFALHHRIDTVVVGANQATITQR
jgi:hypothetical protein